ncbi:rabenosyn-5-like [Babylonia areolata]|uniref:rabenosyn-5-like n=1 Tax=Babylonia areolata TaxID=304850 RepID=UPI003FD5AAFC
MAAAQSEIIEGFLCPMCMKDFGTVTQLQHHFEDAHNAEDKAVFQQLKGFFDKAKKKIMGDKETNPFIEQGSSSGGDGSYAAGISGYDPTWWEPQDLGATRSHLDLFKAIRGARVDHFVVETNKLLIRLDKLMAPDAPTEPKRRKAFEMSVVRWIPDKEVPACFTCLKAFGILLRRHHCRLCGGIMCDKCSQFLTHSFAQKLINPAFSFEGQGFLKRSNSNTSLNSLMGLDGEQHMRVCSMCRQLLERRDSMAELRNTKPPIVQLYEKMKMCIEEAESILPQYLPMVDSLSQGETVHSYRDAMILRTKLVKLYEAVDSLSKRILQFGLNADPPPNPKQIYLQKALRIYASNFMQENLMGLQNLPTEEEVKRLQEIRKVEIQRKIAAERQAAMEAQERERLQREKDLSAFAVASSSSSESPARSEHTATKAQGHRREDSTASNSSLGQGWKPEGETEHASRIADPMLQQMEIIRGYIRQAKQAQRLDEVAMLEQNLRDLQLEYTRQRQMNDES